MIELRFVERVEYVDFANAPPEARLVRVLQYSQRFLPYLAASGDIAFYVNPSPEWVDVPLESLK